MLSRFRGLLRFWTLLLACALCLTAQSKRPEDLAVGKILVTTRDAGDPLFAQSVILLVEYDQTGVLGLMVNRRTTVPLSRALREVKGSAGRSDPIYVGGPVELDTAFALARAPRKPAGGVEVFGNLYFITARTALEKALGAPANPAALRFYLGYCGWTPRQLENEVRLGVWHIFNRSEDLPFDADPSTLWSRMIGRAEGQIARLTLPGMETALLPPGR